MSEALPLLWIVVPCYNEEKVLPITSESDFDPKNMATFMEQSLA
ncbi:MAG: glycosyltransferase [Treponema sp.]|nr:glycosyltransferase [Treponema sp.]